MMHDVVSMGPHTPSLSRPRSSSASFHKLQNPPTIELLHPCSCLVTTIAKNPSISRLCRDECQHRVSTQYPGYECSMCITTGKSSLPRPLCPACRAGCHSFLSLEQVWAPKHKAVETCMCIYACIICAHLPTYVRMYVRTYIPIHIHVRT